MSASDPHRSKLLVQRPPAASPQAARDDWDEDTVVLPSEYEEQLQGISRRLARRGRDRVDRLAAAVPS